MNNKTIELELMPTDENLIQTYLDDSIGRNEDIFYFIQLLNALSTNYSIAIDGNWGSGKTFFVKQAKMILDANNSHIDSDDDPVLLLIYNIVNDVNTYYSFENGERILKVAAAILESFTDIKWTNIINSFKSNSPLAELMSAKNIEIMIKDFLDELLIERGNRIVIFIDELDRCNPSYAVKLLERIKYYFTNDRRGNASICFWAQKNRHIGVHSKMSA